MHEILKYTLTSSYVTPPKNYSAVSDRDVNLDVEQGNLWRSSLSTMCCICAFLPDLGRQD